MRNEPLTETGVGSAGAVVAAEAAVGPAVGALVAAEAAVGLGVGVAEGAQADSSDVPAAKTPQRSISRRETILFEPVIFSCTFLPIRGAMGTRMMLPNDVVLR